jgi:glycosyltransferase involved in cell wall biosynthesis
MLSILIPIYNYSVAALVTELHRQAMQESVKFEIIAIEDGSIKLFAENKTLEDLHFVRYSVLPQNIGRAAIRNKLACMALYENLLFIDCDATIDNSEYIKNYLPFLNKNEVVVGGIKQMPQSMLPANTTLRLKYGMNREQKIDHFTTFNFLVPKNIFEKIHFDETISGYGYEDTLFGYELNMRQIPIRYIKNKLVHTGIDENAVFLKKVEHGIKNLYMLYVSGKYPFLCKTSKILKTFTQIKRLHLIKIFRALERSLHCIIRKNLLSKNPSLFLFDIYKLGVFCKIAKNH